MKIARTYGTVALAALSLAGTAGAAEILVSSDITTSTTWTSNNRYNLQGQIYVRPGATLTIQKGTVVASDLGGGLAVTRDARLICQGTGFSFNAKNLLNPNIQTEFRTNDGFSALNSTYTAGIAFSFALTYQAAF